MKSVLVIEDRQAISFLLQVLIEDLGHKVILVENGRDALNFLKKNKVDLIILDLIMPIMGGEEFLEEFEAKGINSKILITTAKTDVVIHGNKYPILRKPYNFEQISGHIEEALNGVK